MDIIKTVIPLPQDFPFSISQTEIEPSLDANIKYHWHDCLEISYVKRGRGCYFVAGKIYEMEPGDIIIFNNIEPHAWKAYPPEPMLQPVLVFNPGLIWSSEINLFDYQYLKPFTERNTNFSNKLPGDNPTTKVIFKFLLEIEDEYYNHSVGYTLMIKAKLLHIMTYLIRNFQDNTKTNENINEKKKKLIRLEKVIEYFNENYSSQIYLKDAAAIAYMNTNYFSTFFKDTMGISFNEYITKLRISKAIGMIEHTNKTLVDIAFECGFNNMSSFYNSYKKLKGARVPSDLRKLR